MALTAAGQIILTYYVGIIASILIRVKNFFRRAAFGAIGGGFENVFRVRGIREREN